MVNKIDDKNYYTYSKTRNVNIPNTGEKFSLNYNNDELQAKDSEKKDKADESERDKSVDSQGGVKLELSSSGQSAASDRLKATGAGKAQTTEERQSIFGMLRELVSAVVSMVKDLFYKIWNDPEPEAESLAVDDDAETETEKSADNDSMEVSEEERLDREIQPYLRKGDLNQVISLLTDNGKKTVAINSTLLTYYDRNGKMVEMNASDTERILRGDRNTRKL